MFCQNFNNGLIGAHPTDGERALHGRIQQMGEAYFILIFEPNQNEFKNMVGTFTRK